MALCEFHNVWKTYGEGNTRVDALEDVSLSVESGEFTVFSGPSGSGKTTLLNLIGCLDQPSQGTVTLSGKALQDLSRRELAALRADQIGFIFQSFNLIPVLTALENVELALQLSGAKGDRKGPAMEALTAVGIGDLANRRPNQMSGGQQQRVAIARALVKKPAIVIADEPTANLDSATGTQVLDIMRELNQKLGITFLFSTHDPEVMALAGRMVVLRDGKIAEDQVRTAPPAGGD